MKKVAILLGLSLTACSTTVPTTLPSAINGIEKDFDKSNAVSMFGDVSNWSYYKKQKFEAKVRTLQCEQGTPDPVITIVADKVTISLNGQFNSSGSFTIAGVNTSPILSLSGSLTNNHQQTVSLPLTLAPLSAIPYVESNRFALTEYIPPVKANVDYINTLENSFNMLQCSTTAAPVNNPIFMGVKYAPHSNGR